jgi:hypothetical protein
MTVGRDAEHDSFRSRLAGNQQDRQEEPEHSQRAGGKHTSSAAYRPTPKTSNSGQGLRGAEHRKALTNPPLHSAIEYPHVGKAVLAQNVRRTGRALVRTSDRDEKARAKRREVVDATREILDGDVDRAFYTAERAFELDRCSYVEHRRRVGLRQSLL